MTDDDKPIWTTAELWHWIARFSLDAFGMGFCVGWVAAIVLFGGKK